MGGKNPQQGLVCLQTTPARHSVWFSVLRFDSQRCWKMLHWGTKRRATVEVIFDTLRSVVSVECSLWKPDWKESHTRSHSSTWKICLLTKKFRFFGIGVDFWPVILKHCKVEITMPWKTSGARNVLVASWKYKSCHMCSRVFIVLFHILWTLELAFKYTNLTSCLGWRFHPSVLMYGREGEFDSQKPEASLVNKLLTSKITWNHGVLN